MSTTDDIKLASIFGNVLAYEPNGLKPAGYELIKDLTVDHASGLKLATYYNPTTRQVAVAVAGTTGMDDVSGYPSLYLGYAANKVQIDVASEYFDKVRKFASENKASVLVSGHSFAGLFVDIGGSKFGFQGVKFDGVGGNSVVNDAAYQTQLQSMNIASSTGGNVTSVAVNGFLGPTFGGGLVKYFGHDIDGTTYCQVSTTRGTMSGVINMLSTMAAGAPGYLVVKLFAGAYSHNSDSINAAFQNNQFTCTWETPAAIGQATTQLSPNSLDFGKLLNLDKQVEKFFDMKIFSQEVWKSYTSWSTSQLVNTGGPGINLNNYPIGGPGINLNPIGAFYESRSVANDSALAITSKTFRIINSNGQALSTSQLKALDLNADGQLSGAELDNLYAWSDLNENGGMEQGTGASNERRTLSQALRDAGLTSLRSRDYEFYTRGNGVSLTAVVSSASRPGAAPANSYSVPLMPAAVTVNFDAVRRASPVYVLTSGEGFIEWRATDIAVNLNGDKLIGTNGDDNFDVNYYSATPGVSLSLVQQFYAGGGNDNMGGSSRSDTLWGGTGNDTLWGYEGNDTMYGEEGADVLLGGAGHDLLNGGQGNDRLKGQEGNDILSGEEGDDTLRGGDGQDQLDGGTGNDKLFGDVGNDTLNGGSGNDVMVGFTASDDAKQTLAAGETDHDVMFGGDGMDSMWGGWGNDTLDGGADDDRLEGEQGADLLLGGAGADVMQGGDGDDKLVGGAGNDWMSGDVGNDQLWGGDGDDTMVGFTPSTSSKRTLSTGETDNDTMDGGEGKDVMLGGLGDDQLWGGAGDDELSGDDGTDILYGEAGDDLMFGDLGDDQLWGGAGNDELQGGSGNDALYGEAGDDLMFGGLGNDQLWGGAGNDELQGGSGNDALYGEAGNDLFFGEVGNDTIYGGDGDDLLLGFTASNDSKKTLAAGESDDDYLYGGAGSDTLLGGLGSDYLDGGAGADSMEGGEGDDVYIVNSVNDVILEQHNEGYDIVISSANYLLNANIEELRLVEGYNIHATGNALNNRLVGNSRDNILDGVTGADTMLGGLGNDSYYVDNAKDEVVEYAAEGKDTVYASLSYTLSDNLENLTLLDFAKPESGMVDDVNVLVYGYPKAFELDYMQGNGVVRYKGTCGLATIANIATQANLALSEADVVQKAIDSNLCATDTTLSDDKRGGTTAAQRQALLTSYGIRNDLLNGYNEEAIANLITGGRGVMIGVDSDRLWTNKTTGTGMVDHVITVTGAVRDAKTGALLGFYIADSGRGLVSDMTRYVPLADFRNAANVSNAHAIYTIEPIKLWDEDITASGNALDNTLVGNRGNNVLTGKQGNDVLVGMAGDDTYVFNRGDGQDTVQDADNTLGNTDVLQLNGIDQTNLWFTQSGNDLQISIMASTDLIKIKDWYAAGSTDNQLERIKTADGRVLYNSDVQQFVQAMAAFGAPAAGQTSWTPGQTSNGQVLLAVTH